MKRKSVNPRNMKTVTVTKQEIDDFIKIGYRRTSRSGGLASRIDRPDWGLHMAQLHSPWNPEHDGRQWYQAMGNDAADHYRRCHSNDTIQLSRGQILKIPPSSGDVTTYVELDPHVLASMRQLFQHAVQKITHAKGNLVYTADVLDWIRHQRVSGRKPQLSVVEIGYITLYGREWGLKTEAQK